MDKLATLISFMYLLTHVITQECIDTVTVGSLSHDDNIVPLNQTFILAGYTVPCSRTVVSWEFCYRVLGITSVTFYPGIWRITEMSGGNLYYELVQSTAVTYDQSVRDTQDPTSNFACQTFNLSESDQFTAPAGSVVGLYSSIELTQLLRTDTNSSITTYQFIGNQSSIRTANQSDVNYNIAIKVHLVTLVDSITTSDTTKFTPTITIVSTSDTSTVTPTTSIVSTSDATTATPTTSLDDMPLSNTCTSSDSSADIIGGVMGGVILVLVITLILCTVMLCMRRSHRKGTFAVDDKVPCNVKLNTNVKMDDNPAYDVTAFKVNLDVPVTAKPSYAAPAKANGEDECNYAQANEFSQHSDLEEIIKVDTNPSHGATGEVLNSTSDTNPHHPLLKVTTEEHDYEYACDVYDHLLHHATAASATGDAKKGHIQAPASIGQSLNSENIHSLSTDDSAKSSNEYDNVNPPKGDDINNETTHDTSDTLYI